MKEQRQITIIDLQKFIIKRDECRQTVNEISNKISEYHYKILELQKSLDATASQEMTQSIQNVSQVIASASQVIDQANSIVEHISANNGIELPDGTYFVILETDKGVKTQMILKGYVELRRY
jgi:methyl-accepting chemotaxis protein